MSNISYTNKINEWKKKEKLEQIAEWVMSGLSMKQVAEKIGISRKQLYEWKDKYSDIRDTLNKSMEVADNEVENALYKKCLGYKETVKEIRVDKDGKQQPAMVREIYIQPDVTAIKFWLANRQKDKWREKVEIEQEHAIKNGVLDDLIGALNNAKENK